MPQWLACIRLRGRWNLLSGIPRRGRGKKLGLLRKLKGPEGQGEEAAGTFEKLVLPLQPWQFAVAFQGVQNRFFCTR